MNWMEQFRQRAEQEQQSESTLWPSVVSIIADTSKRERQPSTLSIPKAASTDRRETERTREKLHIYCFHCRQPTTHAEMPCDLEQYAADWLMYVCGMCGLKAYARKDLEMKEGEKQL